MKNYSNIFRTMAALILTGAAFSACTPDEEMLANRTYTMTINATQGYNDATKGLDEGPNNTIISTWDDTNTIRVYNVTKDYYLTGTLTPSSISNNGKTAILTGEVSGSVGENDELRLERGYGKYNSQNGSLESIAQNCDNASCVVTVDNTDDGRINLKESSATFINEQAIVYFTFEKEGGDLSVKSLSIGSYYMDISPNTSATIALPGSAFNSTITATEATTNNVYSCTGASLTNGQVYHITLNMKPKTTK